jgi:hypothetical protein
MKTRFEEYIAESIRRNTSEVPDRNKAWEVFAIQKRKLRKRKIYFKLAYAAMILTILGVGGLLYIQFNHSYPLTEYYTTISTEVETTESYYAILLEQKYLQIELMGAFDKKYFDLFYKELEMLDNQYNEHKNNLKQFGIQDDIVRAMIQNQRKKLEVLENLILQIQKIKKYENLKTEI